MLIYPYDLSFDPPAPLLPLKVGGPFVPTLSATVRAFIDSGADVSAIPQALARELQLRRAGLALIGGYDGKINELPTVLVELTVPERAPSLFRAVVWQEEYALLGRDVLNSWKVTLDGPRSSLEIE